MNDTLYKIADVSALAKAEASGVLEASADDVRDGFIHLSTAGQVQGTLDKHFAGEENLMLLAFNAGGIGEDLRWEKSRGGQAFPHLYGELPLSALEWSEPLPISADGRHVIPEAVLAKMGGPR
ncbi:hypothetical protein A7A08_01810 [Methyloligella halotolerans]|uniref:DUF952 domain-containing protein n=1 Tax=Methyloligella halotolerans TaxID=1177755 RepID=A0A1E2RXU7_9HYPH|nr:DUF952 domain-containing protein [Methyloligella halotolerans]ODA67066.1 hypothetical protein A7A08_01810 [Methyloligella halotolerans]